MISFQLLFFTLLIRLSSSLSCHSDADVIIIGAGMAGISAAQRLQEHGINNIIILEGSNRVGGRMKSTQIGGVTVSLGPGWIQGIDPADPDLHPLWELAQKYGGLRGFYPDYNSLTNYDTQGNQPNESLFRWNDYANALKSSYDLVTRLEKSGECDGVTLRYGLNVNGWTTDTPIDKWIEWYKSDYSQGTTPDNVALCLSLLDSTYTNFTSPGSEATDFYVTDPNGYEKIIQCMADEVKQTEETRLLLGAVVTTIDWSSNDCVCVTANLNGEAKQYCGRYAIPTVSVGVLQAKEIQFIPKLPEWKQEVIGRFGMSIYIHIVMEFSEVFWDSTQQVGYISNIKGLYPVFLDHHLTFEEHPKVLEAIVTGENARRILTQDKAVTISEIEQILSTMYPTANVTVVNSAIGDWLSDPLFRGSFIDYSSDLRFGDFERLGDPIGNLYLSGSATSVNFAGYVHGAYFAGRETAAKVIGQLKPSKAINEHTNIFIVLLRILWDMLT